MKNLEIGEGQIGLRSAVVDEDLCTGCGACVNLCPYIGNYKDKIYFEHECDREVGRCYKYCPRTPTDVDELRRLLFEPTDVGPEMGPVKGLYLVRSTNEKVRAAAQHGGTVTSLISMALKKGIIDSAILTAQQSDLLPQGAVANDEEEVIATAGSKFVVSPTVGMFNKACKGNATKIGVVATPCQCLALAKMRIYAVDDDRPCIDKLRLVIGLFCGWAFSWRRLVALLSERIKGREILGMDIPPSKHKRMDILTDEGTVEIPVEDVRTCVRPSCNYCMDMTAEFSDISVGSARSPEGWEVDKGWNQVITRTALGEEMLEMARDKGILEIKTVSDGALNKLKAASMNKKRVCAENLAAKSGSRHKLYYVNPSDSSFKQLKF